MLELTLAVSAAILISALCSLLEAILYSVPISHIETLVQRGRSAGHILRRLRENVDRPISAILSLNTIANTAGAVIAGAAAANVFGYGTAVTELYFPAAFTLAILLLSEIVPKTAGVVYNRPLAGLVARPLQALVWLFTPLIWLCRLATRAIARGHTEQDISGEEIISLTRLGQRTGAIEADEARAVQNILSLKSKAARDAMTPRTVVFALSDRLTVEAAYAESGIWSHSRVPVYDKDFEDIVGIVLRRNFLAALAEGRGKATLAELMQPVHFVEENTTLDRILEMFLQRREHLFVVIDEYGGLAGVLTLEDVLEEILGREIVDESDRVENLRDLARRRRRQTLEARAQKDKGRNKK